MKLKGKTMVREAKRLNDKIRVKKGSDQACFKWGS